MGRIEATIASVWREVLSQDTAEFNSGADFFELGGDSMLATVALTRLRDDHGFRIRLRAFFDNPTIGGLAAYVRERQLEGRR